MNSAKIMRKMRRDSNNNQQQRSGNGTSNTDQNTANDRMKWTTCALSRARKQNRPLWPPHQLYFDKYGNLLHYESILEYLIKKKQHKRQLEESKKKAKVEQKSGDREECQVGDAENPVLSPEDELVFQQFSHIQKLKNVTQLRFALPPTLSAAVSCMQDIQKRDGENGNRSDTHNKVVKFNTDVEFASDISQMVSSMVRLNDEGRERIDAHSLIEGLICCPATGLCGSTGQFPFIAFTECGHCFAEKEVIERAKEHHDAMRSASATSASAALSTESLPLFCIASGCESEGTEYVRLVIGRGRQTNTTSSKRSREDE